MEGVIKATPEDAGCWVEGWWGQYGLAHLVQKAESYGYGEGDQRAVVDLADRHIAAMGPSTEPGLTFDEHEALSDAADDVEQWLNDHVAPEGYSFGWWEGEFFLWPDGQWEDPFGMDQE